MRTRILVIGLGNTIMGDDGLGYCFIKAVKACNGVENAELMELGAMTLGDIGIFEGRDLVIVVDAVNTDKPPGTLVIIEADPNKADKDEMSLVHSHDIDPLRIIAIAHSAGLFSGKIILVGIVPKSVEIGRGLSREVLSRIGDLYDEVKRVLEGSGAKVYASRACVVEWVTKHCTRPLLD